MPNFEVDYLYKIEEYGTHVLEASDKDEAESLTRAYVQDTFDQCFGIEVEEVREVSA